ncbi:MFS transporter [Streptomyces sp. NPDC021020]|uniref:MFS transporter n=1 Tax=Streptomyces sp. NPDC021020 TaxID=3365109 RepID=UPI0037BA8776
MTAVLTALRRTAHSGTVERLYFVRAVDALSSATATYAIPLLVLVTTRSAALTGLAFLMEWAPRLAAFAVAGPLVDRHGAARVFRATNLVRAAGTALAAAVLLVLPGTGSATTGVVLVLGPACGLLSEVSFLAVETLGSEAGRRTGAVAHRVQAVQTGIDQGAVLVGPLLGGLLLLAAPSVLLAAVAALAVLAAVTTPDRNRAEGRDRMPGSLATGWRTLRRTPALLWLVGGLAASNLASGVLQAATPITLTARFEMSTASIGTVWSAAAVASLIAVWIARRAIDRWQVWPVGAVAAALCTAACFGIALSGSTAAYTATAAVFLGAEGALTVVLRTLRARLIAPAAFASTLAVTIIVVLLPLPLAGALVAAVPASALPRLLLACATVQGLVLGACFLALRRHLPRTPPPAAERAESGQRTTQLVDQW